MSALVAPQDVAAFRDLLTARIGLRVEDRDVPHLAAVLGRRVAAVGEPAPAPYLARLAAEPTWRAEIDALAAELTVGETYFFRAAEQLDAFFEVALPERLAAAGAPLEVLCAGCATGEEPYSVAIGLRERRPDLAAGAVVLTGIDLNPAAIRRAARGRYRAWSMRATPAGVRSRWFRPEGTHLVLDEAIRAMVRLEPRNLHEPDPAFWRPGRFQAIFCRNVLIYFDRAAAREVVARLAGALAPGGYLFLGAAESLRGLSEEFHLRHGHGAFYYQRRGADEPPGEALPVVLDVVPAPPPRPAEDPGAAAPWADAIHAAAARIARLSRGAGPLPGPAAPPAGPVAGPPAEPPPAAPPPAGASGPDDPYADAVAHLAAERFAEALDALAARPAERWADPEAALLEGAALTNMGRLAEAERLARAVLAHDEFSPEAHYLLAIGREQAGDRAAAIELDETALYLEPGFAMARLHLGLLAAREGDAGRARRELAAAADLLADEDPRRLAIFGGGLGREALQAVCRATLAQLGAAP